MSHKSEQPTLVTPAMVLADHIKSNNPYEKDTSCMGRRN